MSNAALAGQAVVITVMALWVLGLVLVVWEKAEEKYKRAKSRRETALAADRNKRLGRVNHWTFVPDKGDYIDYAPESYFGDGEAA